jgi:prepilin-type N-terminal cleavage/methylation domain-containing protein
MTGRGGWRQRPSQDAGFTLVELMVAMALMMVVITTSLTAVITAQKATTTSQQVQNLNEEARQAMNRMARDLRQATVVVTAVNADGPLYNPSGITAIRFQGDYNGDSCAPSPATATADCTVAYSAANPEDITYCFDHSSKQLYVIDNQASGVTPITSTSTSCQGGQPLLAGNVSGLQISYRSALYSYDTSPADGVITWRELDSAGSPVGNGNGRLDVELPYIDSVSLLVTMSDAGHTQQYRTQVDLRNLSQ